MPEVFASATGPGLAGLLIDAGFSYLGFVVLLGTYCLAVSALMLKVVPRLKARDSSSLAAQTVRDAQSP